MCLQSQDPGWKSFRKRGWKITHATVRRDAAMLTFHSMRKTLDGPILIFVLHRRRYARASRPRNMCVQCQLHPSYNTAHVVQRKCVRHYKKLQRAAACGTCLHCGMHLWTSCRLGPISTPLPPSLPMRQPPPPHSSWAWMRNDQSGAASKKRKLTDGFWRKVGVQKASAARAYVHCCPSNS